jgi:diguanylate cyclase (GGDEF)-like protein/PAS domain S-box-containing protein
MRSIRSERPDVQIADLMEAAGDAVFRLDANGNILFASNRATELIGADTVVVGQPLTVVASAVDHAELRDAMAQAIDTRRPSRINVRVKTQTASMWVELVITAYAASADMELLVIGRDISDQQATQERLRHMATHDALTGLPNRALLSDRIRMAIAQSRRSGKGFAVVALDLDGFKKVNDALGHAVGDILLGEAAFRLSDAIRAVDTLARVGGDEFIAVLPGAVTEAEIQGIARRMIAAMQLPFDIQGQLLYVGTSVGVAVYPAHGESEVKLLAHADTAMKRAKETGKARCVIYDHGKFLQPEHDVSMEAAMFQAVREGEFLLHYQPIVDAHSRRIMGFEALMRWDSPELGRVGPTQFIPMAESNGLINLLGAWALKAACMQLKHFEKAAGRQLYISVNVSPRQFRNDKFIDIVDEALALAGLQGEQLLLEITEGILMSDPDHAEVLLNAMVERKVRIAIDDFGTGYSSLAYLKRFPITTLKIDRAFIKDIPDSAKDGTICNAVLGLANHLHLSTVAEGVENEAQLAFLANNGCELIQGFFTGAPVLPETAIHVLLAEAASNTVQ